MFFFVFGVDSFGIARQAGRQRSIHAVVVEKPGVCLYQMCVSEEYTSLVGAFGSTGARETRETDDLFKIGLGLVLPVVVVVAPEVGVVKVLSTYPRVVRW